MIKMIARAGAAVAAAAIIVTIMRGESKRSLKMYYSPDRKIAVAVETFSGDGNADMESRLAFSYPGHRPFGYESFLSKDREHGMGVMKAEWTPDSQFFVFSLIASGGRDRGHFPVYYFSREKTSIRMLDTLMGVWVADPDFQLEYDDIILVSGRERFADGSLGDTLSRASHLAELDKR